MSTTTDLQVAVRYGLGPRSLLFVLTCENFMQYGAELQWLSAFPAEAEAHATLPHLCILYPLVREHAYLHKQPCVSTCTCTGTGTCTDRYHPPAQVCYPPFTYLQPTGRVQSIRAADQSFKIVEVQRKLQATSCE